MVDPPDAAVAKLVSSKPVKVVLDLALDLYLSGCGAPHDWEMML